MAAPWIGSFLGVVIDRLPAGRPILIGRSACDRCRRSLGIRDLIPIVSWFLSAGRCRHCAAPLGVYLPFVELAALAIALWALAVLPGWIALAGAGFGWTLLALAWIDGRTFLLPDALTVPLGAAGVIVIGVIEPAAVGDHLLGAVTGFGGFVALRYLYRVVRGRDGLGGGDAKLLGALGAWVGWYGLPSVVLFAAVSGLLWVLAQATVRHRSVRLNRHIPFGPHLCLGGWLVWLYGPLLLG